MIQQYSWVDHDGWDFNEAWLLTALGGSGRRGSDLSEWIGATDAFNHDVLPAEAAAQAVGRLIASGLVERDSDRFRLTKEGATVYKSRRGGMFEQPPSVLTALRQVACVEGEAAFTAAEYIEACEAYGRRASGRAQPS